MTDTTKDPRAAAVQAVLAAALNHVPFDGWSEATLRAAIADSGVAPGLARALFPRGGVDLAAAFHRQGDALMRDRLAAMDLSALRFRDRVAQAVRTRLEVVADREALRRGATLFALPQHAPRGARLIWGTADAIWTALGDTAADVNWYTRRATLSAVYAATVLYWLGDETPDRQATWDFLDRRIADVMRIEGAKASLRRNPLARGAMDCPLNPLNRVRAPGARGAPDPAAGLPGRISA